MQPERWQKCSETFNSVLDLPPEERAAFLDEQCHDDEALRREIERLLKYYHQSDGFIESPAFETAPYLLLGDNEALLGRQLEFYRIDSILGVGGMGVVYLAQDERLGRKVALKLLPPALAANEQQLKKLKHEARTASALNHPNIVTIHEIGEADGTHYIATEFIEGITLRERIAQGPIPPNEAMEIGQQIASALSVAHAAGIVHRDIKPENIMLRPDGYVKILDFGIAKLTPLDISSATPTATQNLITGTARYMSPEQARGQPVDARSDIWSLGVILYEMIIGHAPFAGETNTDVIASILRSDAPPLDRSVPSAIATVIKRALQKDPGARYQNATELRADLVRVSSGNEKPVGTKWLALAALAAILTAGVVWLGKVPNETQHVSPAASSIPARKSIAVLPFADLSSDHDQQNFCDGTVDEILTHLTKLAELKVISRTSTMQYASETPRNLAEIAKALGVAYVMEGSVQRSANRVRINAQLIDSRTDVHVWAESYDRNLADVFAVQSEIAKAIAQQLQIKLSPAESARIDRGPTADVAAFDLYTRARALFWRAAYSNAQSDQMSFQAVDLLNQAVARDPSYFEAFCLLANTHDTLYFYGTDHTPKRLALAEAALESALRLQPDSPRAHIARAEHLYWGYLQFDSALAELKAAAKSLPNNSRIFELTGYILRRQGALDDGVSNLERALELDPRNFRLLQQIALSYEKLRRYRDMASALDRALEVEPGNPETRAERGMVELEWKADTRPLRAAIRLIGDGDPKALELVADLWFAGALADRDTVAATAALDWLGDGYFHGDGLQFYRSFGEALLARMTNDREKMHVLFEKARVDQQKRVENQPDYGPPLCVLGIIDAALGRKEEALREGRHALELTPPEKDAVNGINLIGGFAIIAAWTGELDLACEQLEKAIRLGAYGFCTYGQLKLSPVWDSLRGNPRFEKTVASLAPNEPTPALPSVSTKSIAVLPFENRSDDKSNAYFADGIQDEILTRLSKIADLKVISRTSSQHYKQSQDLSEIARQLGVAHIVEGSVQKSGNSVRVNVQLVKAANDSHVWAETFDRKLTDVFAVESEIARTIAAQLQAKLTGREEQVLAAIPTENPQAYDAYLRGLAYSLRTAQSQANALGAQKYFKEAVRLDPKFALAWALLAYEDARGYISLSLQPTPALREEARQAAETALNLQPNLGEALHANGYYHYACLNDYDTAVRYFEQARPFLPNNSRIPESLAYVARRQGQWDRSENYLNEAERFDPRNVRMLTQHALSCIATRRFPDALRKLDQILDITPDDPYPVALKASVAQLQGDPPRAAALLAPLHPNAANTQVLETQAYQAILERQPAQIIARLKELLAHPDPALGYNIGGLRFYLGWAQEVAGDHAAAVESWQQARRELEPLLKEQPQNYLLVSALAFSDMGLADKAAALQLAESAMADNPMEKDAVFGARPLEIVARVAAHTGEHDRAIAAIEKLLSMPYGGLMTRQLPLTPALLRLDPMFESLQKDPRFQKLIINR